MEILPTILADEHEPKIFNTINKEPHTIWTTRIPAVWCDFVPHVNAGQQIPKLRCLVPSPFGGHTASEEIKGVFHFLKKFL